MGKATGGVRLAKMLRGGGQIASAFIWIDTYNQLVSDIAGTITTRVDGACQYFVSVER